MTLYEINKSAYASLPKMTSAEKERARDKILNYVEKHNNYSREYFMLLNNDLHYYTIFCWMNKTAKTLIDEIMDITESLGKLKAIEINDNDAIEFWITNQDNECNMYIFFDYTNGVIEV